MKKGISFDAMATALGGEPNIADDDFDSRKRSRSDYVKRPRAITNDKVEEVKMVLSEIQSKSSLVSDSSLEKEEQAEKVLASARMKL